MRTITRLPGVFYFIGALIFDVTRIPLGAWWTVRSGFLPLKFLLLGRFRNCFYGLHHVCRVQLGTDPSPRQSPHVQVTEDPRVVVPSPLPCVGRKIIISGKHCSHFKQMEQMLQPTVQLLISHWRYQALTRCKNLADIAITEHDQVSILGFYFVCIVYLAILGIFGRPDMNCSTHSHTLLLLQVLKRTLLCRLLPLLLMNLRGCQQAVLEMLT